MKAKSCFKYLYTFPHTQTHTHTHTYTPSVEQKQPLSIHTWPEAAEERVGWPSFARPAAPREQTAQAKYNRR